MVTNQQLAHAASQIGPWGDPAIASYYGTTAFADGTMDAASVRNFSVGLPEPLFVTDVQDSNQIPKFMQQVTRQSRGGLRIGGYCHDCSPQPQPQPFNLQITRQGDLTLSQGPTTNTTFPALNLPAFQFPQFLGGSGQNPANQQQVGIAGDQQINDPLMQLASNPQNQTGNPLYGGIGNCSRVCGVDEWTGTPKPPNELNEKGFSKDGYNACLSDCEKTNARTNAQGFFGGANAQTIIKYVVVISVGLLIAYAGFKVLTEE